MQLDHAEAEISMCQGQPLKSLHIKNFRRNMYREVGTSNSSKFFKIRKINCFGNRSFAEIRGNHKRFIFVFLFLQHDIAEEQALRKHRVRRESRCCYKVRETCSLAALCSKRVTHEYQHQWVLSFWVHTWPWTDHYVAQAQNDHV